MSFRTTAREIRSLLSWLEGSWSGGHPVDRALEAMRRCFAAGGTLYVCGNGGSASQAAHYSAELASIHFRCVNLSTDSSVITALSNDFSFDEIFSWQLGCFLQIEDALLVLSTSGKSQNILQALRMAEVYGVPRIVLTGNPGNIASTLADCPIVVPSSNTQRIQEIHLMILHQWFEQLKEHRLERCDCIERGIA